VHCCPGLSFRTLVRLTVRHISPRLGSRLEFVSNPQRHFQEDAEWFAASRWGTPRRSAISWGSWMTENQRRESDVLCARDLVLRGITFFGLIAAVLLALLAIQWA
jgi:hypothetical protein